MKNFNWEAFKRGDIAVHCDTEEKAKDFLKKCDKEGIRWNTGEYTHEFTEWNKHKKETSYSYFIKGIVMTRLDLDKEQGLKIIKWEIEDMKELTFTEVIANIKEGEVWRNRISQKNLREISKKKGIIDFTFLDTDRIVLSVREEDTFILQRKEYTFQEAFKAYEEGKVIESCIEGHRYKKEGGEDYYFDYGKNKYMLLEWDIDCFTITSIRNKWYIND